MWKAYLKVVLFVLFLVALVIVTLVALSRPAKAEELRAKIVCTNGVCVPVSSGNVNAARVKALLRRAAQLKSALENAGGVDKGRVGKALGELAKAVEELKNLKESVDKLERLAKSGEYKGKVALAKLAEAERRLAELEQNVSAQRKAHIGLTKKVGRLVERRVNLELGVLGGAAWKYGATVSPLAISLVLPMGETGVWKTRVTAGLGLSPSIAVGWLAMGTLTRSLARGQMELGPAVLGMGDAGDLVGETRGWVLGGGVNVRLNISARAFVSLTPFLGVASKTFVVGVGEWVPATPATPPTPNCPCASGGKDGYWSGGTTAKRCVGFSGGALVSIGAVLF